MRILNLIIQLRRGSDGYDTTVVPYAVRDGLENPEAALRAAVQDFLTSDTEEARQALDYSYGDFNWGDAMSFVPKFYFIGQGLTPIEEDSIDVIVVHDEMLEKPIAEDKDD